MARLNYLIWSAFTFNRFHHDNNNDYSRPEYVKECYFLGLFCDNVESSQLRGAFAVIRHPCRAAVPLSQITIYSGSSPEGNEFWFVHDLI